ncbi:lactonase family protein [Neorhodopirellula lusitana]|uniref:lactonase family protein n=1 Tax=Neorhodopirellula lusitana TaxID=445327 RepID=UPI003850EC09
MTHFGCIRLVFLFAVFCGVSVQAASAGQVDVWFGTITPKSKPGANPTANPNDGQSRGIYHATFDTDNGQLSTPTLAAECDGPGFLTLHPSQDVLYSTGSPTTGDTATGDQGGDVSAFRINGDKLEWLGSAKSGDGGAAHLSTDREGKVLMSAQYGGGSTSLYQLDEAGEIGGLVDTKSHAELLPDAGSRVVGNRQNSPHAHWTGTSPDNRFVFVPDLGMDKVVIWKLDTAKPSLTHHGFGVCPPGGGPRHMKFSPAGDRIYVLNELALSITAFDYDAQSGTMTPGQTIPILSEETKAKETFNSASEIRVHPSGKFVYAASRGHDSISAFRVDQDGQMSLVEIEPIRGGWPRNFAIDPTGKWIIAAGRDSNTATVFQIDQATGELTFVRQTQMVPKPICVLFGGLN